MSQTLLLFLPIGGQEVLIIALLIFLLFGATRLPQLAKALGQSKKAFREGIEEGERDDAKKEPEKLA
jgi:sec-independent protein translocase protein TatA